MRLWLLVEVFHVLISKVGRVDESAANKFAGHDDLLRQLTRLKSLFVMINLFHLCHVAQQLALL